MNPELVKRSLAGAAMIVVACAAVWLGGWAFWLLLAVVGVVMMGEWAALHATSPRHMRLAQYGLFAALALMCPRPTGGPGMVEAMGGAGPGFLTLGLLIGAAFFIVIVTNRRALAMGAIYVGLPILSLLLIRRQEEGILWTLWVLPLVWMTDIGAYATGRAIGGPKLAPKISPAKTWAGLAGGVVLASLFAAALHVRFGLPLRLTLATPALAVLAQVGDLYESWLKRRAGVKDSGNLLPGHGGVLDRLDGLVPVAPVAAFLAVGLPKLYPLLP